MNTTNLITDYIISGLLGVLALILPIYLIDRSSIDWLFSLDIKNETVIVVSGTIVCYAFGILYNQLSDWLEDIYFRLFRIKVVQDSETKLKNDLRFDHHYALQLVVAKSETAYDYISFRRTMIRIIRAILCLLIIVPVLHVFISICYRITGVTLSFSFTNLIISVGLFLLTLIPVLMLKKLYKGYYAAITNFAKILNEPNP